MTGNSPPLGVALLSSADIARRLSVHVVTFQRYLREGKLVGFPAPREFPGHGNRYLSSEVEAWIASRPVVRGQNGPKARSRRGRARRSGAAVALGQD